MRIKKLAFVSLIVAGCSAGTAVAVTELLGGAPSSPGTLAILAQPVTAEDALPPELLDNPVVELVDGLSGARLALVREDWRYYIAPGKEETACLLMVRGAGPTLEAASTCAPTDLLKKGTIYLSEPQGDGSVKVQGIVGDGYTTVSSSKASTQVVNNLFVLEGSTEKIELTGEGFAKQEVDLGLQSPLSTVEEPAATNAQ